MLPGWRTLDVPERRNAGGGAYVAIDTRSAPGGHLTMGKYREIARDLREPAKSLREAQPETFAAFGALHEATMADGE
ncbi:MAG: hypothetical protein JJE46_08915, partial [Acidimicrobiia bacterium]|nr:hypothetical protein [Acidimicrobiia bacterium]